MASSAVLRPWISLFASRAPQISRYANLNFSPRRVLAANRMVTTMSGGVSSAEYPPPPAPWLMLAQYTNTGEAYLRFYCCAKRKALTFFQTNHGIGGEMGISQGWLAYDDDPTPYLLDPTTDERIDLPPLKSMGKPHSLVLSDDRQGKGHLAFIIFGSDRRLAFCSPCRSRSRDWTVFGGSEYDCFNYSTLHRRLFCLTSTLNLEVWDVGHESPRLDWAVRLEILDSPTRPELTKLRYLACAEQSGELFLVVRCLDLGREQGRDKWGYYVSPTVDFEVYKMEGEGRKNMRRMENSLEGYSMFVGRNQPFAIKDVQGVEPDSVYFSEDTAVCDDPGDSGIFDYRKKITSGFHWGFYGIYYPPRPAKIWI